MIISAQQIKELREKTGAGMADIKKALEEGGGDSIKAIGIIERRLGNIAGKKMGRETHAGLIESYMHSNNRMASLVEIFCETDFVARSPAFKEFAHGIAMHVAAMNPLYLSLDMVPRDLWESEKSRFEHEAKALGKPSHIVDEIVEGKLTTHFGSFSLMSQEFVRDPDKSVQEIVHEAIGKFGENITIGRFVRFAL